MRGRITCDPEFGRRRIRRDSTLPSRRSRSAQPTASFTPGPRARRAALSARRPRGIRPGVLRRRPSERLDARHRPFGGKFRDEDLTRRRDGRDERRRAYRAAVDAGAVVVLVRRRLRMLGVMRVRHRRRSLSRSRNRSLKRFATEGSDHRPSGSVHRARMQQPGLSRDEREPECEQTR